MDRTVETIMTGEVKTMQADQVLLEALRFLHENHVRHVPILDGEKLVGVLTDRDVKRATPSALVSGQREVWEKIVNETQLKTVMARDPLTATPGMTIREALRMFVEERIGCLPVLDGDRLVGIVTASDMFRAMLEILDGVAGESGQAE